MSRLRVVVVVAMALGVAGLAYAVCTTRVYCSQHQKTASYDSVKHKDGKCWCIYKHVGPNHTLKFECDE